MNKIWDSLSDEEMAKKLYEAELNRPVSPPLYRYCTQDRPRIFFIARVLLKINNPNWR